MTAPPDLARRLIAQANATMAAHQAGDLAAAERGYRELVPQLEHPALLSNFGALLVQTGRPAEAVPHLRRAACIAKDRVGALANLAAALRDTGGVEEAECCLRESLALDPAAVGALATLGALLTERDALDEAESCLRRAIALQPAVADHLFNLGVLLRRRMDIPAAEAAYRRALVLDPGHVEAADNLAVLLGDSGRLEEGLALYRALLDRQPGRHDRRFWYGNMLVAAGWWREGWVAYEARREYLPGARLPEGLAPWTGAPLPGGTLLLRAEQGIGDALLAVRFLPAVLARVRRVVLAVHRPLVRLLADSLPGAVTVLALEDDPGMVDAALPLMSLFAVLDVAPEDVDGRPYLAAPERLRAAWRRRLGSGPGDRPTVGIVWAGNPSYVHDRYRSPGLEAVRPLLETASVRWVVLQVGPGRAALADRPLPNGVLDLGAEVADFADTAAILAELDLVVSSDTAVAHLAGALGRPCHVMAPALLGLYWLGEEPGLSRWYDSVTVHRQARLGDWSDVVASVAAALD